MARCIGLSWSAATDRGVDARVKPGHDDEEMIA
jgi:hypothetical protein